MKVTERVLPWSGAGTPVAGVTARKLSMAQRDACRRALEARLRLLAGADGPLDWATALFGDPVEEDLDFILKGGLKNKHEDLTYWASWQSSYERALKTAMLPSLEELGIELAHQVLRNVTRHMNEPVVRLAAEIVRREKADP